MGISVCGGKQRAEINVTPMIDVMLVLIIIFMVITPLKQVGLNTLVPQTAAPNQEPAAPANDIVITVHRDNTVSLNQEMLPAAELEERLRRLFRNRPSRVIFVRGEKDLEFGQVAEVIDRAHGAGVYRIALMTF
jgi:biopolymer transport protein TolR